MKSKKRTYVVLNLCFKTSHKNTFGEILTAADDIFLHLHIVWVTTQKLLTWISKYQVDFAASDPWSLGGQKQVQKGGKAL